MMRGRLVIAALLLLVVITNVYYRSITVKTKHDAGE